jgi:hypothetical protein
MDKELKDESKKRFKAIINKKMTTIMIGSLAIIEEELIKNSDDIKLQSVYDIVRQRILDLGNSQIRGINLELDTYDIESNRYSMKMEVKQRIGRNE